MAKTIRLIGCAAGVTAMLILLLPLCLLRNDRPKANGDGNSNRSHQVVSPTPAPAPAPATLTTSTDGAPFNDSWRHHMLRLHRQKRYLLFPEGSSFQLVFDIIIPIVDYTNYAILGITCAVAWELPSKAPSELIENVLTRINDGTIGTVRRNGSAPDPEKDSNRSPANWQPVHAPSAVRTSQPRTPDRQPAHTANSHGSYYTNILRGSGSAGTSAYANANWNANANGQQQLQATLPGTAPGPANWACATVGRKVAATADGRPTATAGQLVAAQQGPAAAELAIDYSQRPRRLLKSPPQHHIYPVFGKRRRRRRRSLEQDPLFERLHLQQHLSSRQLLFGKIERLYKAQQLNGTACVLRALCESAQRQQQSDGGEGGGAKAFRPQSFIIELLSAIFQLPASNDGDEVEALALKHISPHYLEAHRQQGNCLQLYSDCGHAFWFE
ncbi:GL21981 [Drosophila persimilis]|uniref:GL21981 n=1 Tax=Drosophila persimilis TaxID=7234 RepID=B4GE98_DROPE|nr:GL21981 [Drosophila persimilis]